MRPRCVDCHNTHLASPKTDWQAGDVRGVLEIALPVDTAVAQTRTGLRGTLGLLVAIAILGLSGLALVIGRLRRSTDDLAQRADALHCSTLSPRPILRPHANMAAPGLGWPSANTTVR